jgi:tRNA-Thr(GGU) m(6)t(6)A37 methyltransferase TsaA
MYNNLNERTVAPIGVAHTPYETTDDAPPQGFADDTDAEIEVFEKYTDALAGIESVYRVTVIYWAHLADRAQLTGDDGDGAFTRRSPHRPNPLSVCTCMVLDSDDRRLSVSGLDAIDGSPVIDIKPALQPER